MKTLFATLIVLAFILAPAITMAQNYSAVGEAPIAQPLVREGTLAVGLVEALKLGTTSDEVEAENILLGVGIAPRNGWISDYPVTPDIVSELRSSVVSAAETGSLEFGRDEAVLAFDEVLTRNNLMVKTDTPASAAYEEEAPAYPDNAMVDNYYYDYGPPPVTYYAPPAYYAGLYSWVPYPFWGWNAWYPGYFMLRDFHRFVYVDKRVYIISNHFFDKRKHRHDRIDARNRFREFHEKRYDDDYRDHRKHFVNKRVVGPSEVRKEAEKAFKSGHDRRRFDADRSRTNFNGSRDIRSGTREVKRENRTFNFSGRREAPLVASPERSGSRPAERTFRSSDRGRREFKSAPRSFNSRPVWAPSGRGRTSGASLGHRNVSPSFGGARGGRAGGSFGGKHRR